MRIQHNIAALNSYRQLGNNNTAVSKNLEKLSSGYRINRAGDDAAGLAISEKMRAQIKGLETAQKNANDGISLVQTAEGNLTEVHSMLNRMVELATQSANGTYDDAVDRANLQKEVESLKSEINRISESANYNGINLLDGSLAKNEAVSINTGTVSTVDGMTLNNGANGKGAKGKYTIDLGSGLMGTGDTIAISGFKLNGTDAIGPTSFAYGTDVKGETAEEQAKSLAEALNKDVNFAQNFDISVDGTKINLVSKEEGSSKASITSAVVTDKTASVTASEKTAATAATAVSNAGWANLLGTGKDGTGTGYNVEAGDIIEFKFTDISGKGLTAKVEITQDMIESNKTLDALTTAVVDKLKATNFNDVDGTAANESLIKVGDMFDITANADPDATAANGSIQVDGKTGIGGTVDAATIYRDGKTVGTVAGTAGSGSAVGTKQVYEITKSTENLSNGDTFSISGTMSDGRTFSVDLVAGKDFEIKGNYNDSAAEIIKALTDADSDLTVTVGTGANAQTVKANTLFGNDATKNEFSVSAAAGVITITNLKGGEKLKGGSGQIANVNFTAANHASATLEKTKGVDQGYATSTIDLDKGLKYGSAVKIGDKTFEIVKDSRDVTSRNNIAVVIDDIENTSSSDIAKKLVDAAKLNGFADKADAVDNAGGWDDTKIKALKEAGKDFIISSTGSEISITTLDKGSSVKAPKLSNLYGDKVDVVNVKFDPSKLNYGDQFEINGNKYEFVEKEEDVSEGSIGVVVSDLKNASAKDVATALADVAQGVKTSVADDGTITIQSMADSNGKIVKPSFVFEGKGLSLQVGDTNKDYQKVNVKINSMSTSALDISDVNISTQEGAAAAIDKIKAAINTVSSTRGDLGAIQNRLEHTINNLGVTTENMTAAESRIRDVDMAKEMMDFTKNNILVQASQAMLAQANQIPQGVLQLLQ